MEASFANPSTGACSMYLSRRQTLAGLAATATMPLISGCARTMAIATPPPVPPVPGPAPISEAAAKALLDSFGENLLALSPESATSLGLDTGARAWMRSRLGDRSIAGQKQVAGVVAADLARANGIDTSALSFSTRTSIEVVKSAYRTALDGFALPYGDVSVGGWRNTPYVVIQNVGAYLDVPRFLDSDHPIKNSADAEAYLARMQSMASQLDGELARIKAARAQGLVPPAFLIDKALKQLAQLAQGARAGGELVESIERRTK
ncbi:MAG: DUF885 family protein, partial [Sphingomicrobium sp.]